MNNSDKMLAWYAGKAKVNAAAALAMVDEAVALGYWPAGYSRKVHAALNKMAVANKFARAHDRRNYPADPEPGLLSSVCDNRAEWYKSTVTGGDLVHSMMFGHVTHAAEALATARALVPYCVNDAERAALATATDWAETFAPLDATLRRLDATRPKPVVVFKTLSRTVVANVGAAMGLDLESVTFPETEWTEHEKDGKVWFEPKLLWPEGTRHNASRYAHGSRAGNDTCHACGHAIRNPNNWVPLFATSPTGPASLWVGKDCAEKLFGCKVTGETGIVKE